MPMKTSRLAVQIAWAAAVRSGMETKNLLSYFRTQNMPFTGDSKGVE